MRKQQVSIRIDAELKNKLDKMARDEVRNLAGMIRKILQEAVNAN